MVFWEQSVLPKSNQNPLPKYKGIWIRFWEPNLGLQILIQILCIHIQILIGFQMWVLFPKYHRTSLQSLGKDFTLQDLILKS